MEDDACLAPITLHRALADAAHRRDLYEGQAAEKVQVHELGQRGIKSRQLVQGSPELTQVFGVRALGDFEAAEGNELELASSVWSRIAAWHSR